MLTTTDYNIISYEVQPEQEACFIVFLFQLPKIKSPCSLSSMLLLPLYALSSDPFPPMQRATLWSLVQMLMAALASLVQMRLPLHTNQISQTARAFFAIKYSLLWPAFNLKELSCIEPITIFVTP